MNIETERLRARIDALGKMLAELERMLAQGQRFQRLAKSNNQKDRPSLTLRHCASSGCAVSKRQSRPSQEQANEKR